MKIGTIFVFILGIIIVFSGCSLLTKPDSTNTLKITQEDEKAIYEYLDTKTNDIQPPSGKGKMFSAFDVLGTDKNKIYIWFFKVEYINNGKEVIEGGGGVSCPLVLNIKRTTKGISIINHDQPVDGENYGKSIRKIFPPNICENISHYSNENKTKLVEVTKARAEKALKD